MPQHILRWLNRETRRYPQLTFDRTADDFECPACRNHCNGSLCSRKRGGPYVPERDGGSRSWLACQGGSHCTVPTPAKKSKSKNLGTAQVPATTRTTTANAQVFDASWSATAVFTGSGEPLGSAFLQGNKARIVPVSQPTASPAAATTPTAPTTVTASPILRRNSSNCKNASICSLGSRARRGGGSCPFRIPTTTSRSKQKKTKGRGRWRAGDAGVSGFGSLWGT
ncbi:hypothetical protein EDB86DRAFT_256694 [Lactarius hatsudake]|nr:hypothetical protein EDB86DRAFT_256694 [Lactarius hatsudake]